MKNTFKLMPTKDITNVVLYQESTSYDNPKMLYIKPERSRITSSDYKYQYFYLYTDGCEVLGTNNPNEIGIPKLSEDDIEYWVNYFSEELSEEFVIETTLAEVYIDGVFKGLYNENTCRNLQLQVKKGVIKDVVKLRYNGYVVNIDKMGKLVGDVENFTDGFYSTSYKLVFLLMD